MIETVSSVFRSTCFEGGDICSMWTMAILAIRGSRVSSCINSFNLSPSIVDQARDNPRGTCSASQIQNIGRWECSREKDQQAKPVLNDRQGVVSLRRERCNSSSQWQGPDVSGDNSGAQKKGTPSKRKGVGGGGLLRSRTEDYMCTSEPRWPRVDPSFLCPFADADYPR